MEALNTHNSFRDPQVTQLYIW